MPTISKVRIVNFAYNDGKRFFLDELINFEDSKLNTMDTYLKLKNGGGKSVLVQLILQNIIPRATIGGRKIDSFFTKSNSHCFVLTEWKLDSSSDKLMTGIAMAAGVNLGEDNDKAARVKYYTFYNQYDSRGDKNDIINMPLSKKDNRVFRAVSYEEIRNIVKASTRIKYFSSDDVRRYQDEIEEYGIIHSEWENVIARINNTEGGVVKFLEGYKTSDSLLNNFIIPGIIGNGEESNPSELMFKNYAESISKYNEKLILRNRMADFIKELKEIQPEIKNLWNCTDEYENAVRNVFDLIFSASKLIETNKANLKQVELQFEALEAEKKHIELEKISNEFYIAEDLYKKSKAKYDDISKRLNEAESIRIDAGRTVNLLLAAKEYKNLIENQKKLLSAQEQIKAIENDNVSDYAAQLKYSLHIAAKEHLSKRRNQHIAFEEELKTLSAEYEKSDKEISLLREKQTDVLEQKNKAEGRKDTLRGIIDNTLKSMGIIITGNFFERYPRKNLNDEEQKIIDQCTKIKEEIQDLKNEIPLLKNQLDKLYAEESEIAVQSAAIKSNIDKYESLKEEYLEKFSIIKSIIEEYFLSEEDVYSGVALSKSEEKLAYAKDELNKLNKELDTVNEQLEHTRKGQLHIPKSAVDFLENKGIEYQTGEKYLLGINAELKKKILSYLPRTAFSVIVENDRDKEKLLSYTDNVWVSAIVPVFTYAEINDILNGNYTISDSVISAYSKEYFDNNSNFVSILENKLENLKKATSNAENKVNEFQYKKETIQNFGYDADYLKKLMSKICTYEENLDELKKRLDEILLKKGEISAYISQKEQCIQEHKANLNKSELILDKFREIIKHTEDFSVLCSEIFEYEKDFNLYNERLKTLSEEHNLCKDKMGTLEEEISKCLNDISRYEQSIKITDKCIETKLLNIEYDTLEKMYNEHFNSISNNLAQLKKKCEDYNRNIIEIKKGIDFYKQNFEFEEEEYSIIEYSLEKEKSARDKKEKFDNLFITLSKEQIEKQNDCKLYQSAMEKWLVSLKELEKELISPTDILGNFELRSKKCEKEIKMLNRKIDDLNSKIKEWCRLKESAEKYSKKQGFAVAENPKEIECTSDTLDNIKDRISEHKDKLMKYEKKYINSVHTKLDDFSKENALFRRTISGLCEPVYKEIKGDKYFTLYENITKDIDVYSERIQKLDIELKDVKESRNQLIDNCLQRGREIYDGLIMLSKKSRVKLASGEKKMIDINLPENIEHNSKSARFEMSRHIDEYIQRFLECTGNAAEYEKIISGCMNLRSLLDCYIGNVPITIKVYKIDSVQSNSGYRTWERALTDNSGGEKFVVFFALILSMMNYSRGIVDTLKKTSGVLIMDNPFGPISSSHLLKPMFDIAHHFRIQLICLSDLDTANILNCFRNVYQLKIKKTSDDYEVVNAVQKEEIEHAFYRVEQMSLF